MTVTCAEPYVVTHIYTSGVLTTTLLVLKVGWRVLTTKPLNTSIFDVFVHLSTTSLETRFSRPTSRTTLRKRVLLLLQERGLTSFLFYGLPFGV
jgi:hypothetical protein